MTKRLDGPSAAARIRVMKRDRFRCTYCGIPGTDAELEIDHITPVSKGGSHHISNLTTSCRLCNQTKGDKAIAPPSSISEEASSSGGLIGYFLHTFDEKGRIRYQGRVIGQMDADTYLVQLFEWFMGDPTTVVPMTKSAVMDTKTCHLYANAETWNHYANMHSKRADQDVPDPQEDS